MKKPSNIIIAIITIITIIVAIYGATYIFSRSQTCDQLIEKNIQILNNLKVDLGYKCTQTPELTSWIPHRENSMIITRNKLKNIYAYISYKDIPKNIIISNLDFWTYYSSMVDARIARDSKYTSGEIDIDTKDSKKYDEGLNTEISYMDYIFSRISGLYFNENNLKPEQIATILTSAPLANIQDINISLIDMNKIDISLLADNSKLSNLQTLVIDSTNINTSKTLSALSTSPYLAGLKTLIISGNKNIDKLDIADLPDTSTFTQLRSLSLSSQGITDDGLFALAKSPILANIRNLDISNNKFGAKGLSALGDSSEISLLHSLNLNRSTITVEMATVLATSSVFARLKYLDLSRANIDDEALAIVLSSKSVKHLQSLQLSSVPITDDIVSAIIDSKYLNKLEYLNLDVISYEKLQKIVNNNNLSKNLKIKSGEKTENKYKTRIEILKNGQTSQLK